MKSLSFIKKILFFILLVFVLFSIYIINKGLYKKRIIDIQNSSINKYRELYYYVNNKYINNDIRPFLEFVKKRNPNLYNQLKKIDLKCYERTFYVNGFDGIDDSLNRDVIFVEDMDIRNSFTKREDVVIRPNNNYFRIRWNTLYEIKNDTIYRIEGFNIRQFYNDYFPCKKRKFKDESKSDLNSQLLWIKNKKIKNIDNTSSPKTTKAINNYILNSSLINKKDVIYIAYIRLVDIEELMCDD